MEFSVLQTTSRNLQTNAVENQAINLDVSEKCDASFYGDTLEFSDRSQGDFRVRISLSEKGKLAVCNAIRTHVQYATISEAERQAYVDLASKILDKFQAWPQPKLVEGDQAGSYVLRSV